MDYIMILMCLEEAFTNLMEKKMEKTLRVFIAIISIWFVSIVENAL